MADDSGGGGGVPVWFITFGDMMSLLLTFFIMLVSLSEMKSEEKYQALMDAFQQQFGCRETSASVIPGELRPRNSALSKITSTGRAKRIDSVRGGTKVQSPIGDSDSAAIVRPAGRTGVGTVLYFKEEQVELDKDQRATLHQQEDRWRGKPQTLEIRGHASIRSAPSGSHFRDNWDLSFERCRRVLQYLVDEQHFDPSRLRISAAAANEPQGSRVEVFLLEEETRGTTSMEVGQRKRNKAEPSLTR